MFKALKRKLSRLSGGSQKSQNFLVTDKKQIEILLSQAGKKKIFLAIHIGKPRQMFNTMLLDVCPERNCIVLDELFPNEGHEILMGQSSVEIVGLLDGVDVRFEALFEGAEEKSGINCYRFKMPEAIYFCQQRDAYRISLAGVNIAFHANTGGSTPGTVHGHLLNISLGGVRIIFHHKVPFSRGNILDECSMTLPGKGVIIFSLLVEYVNNSQDDEMVLGGHYHMLPKAEGILIKEYVTEMMRKMAKQAHDNQLPDTAQD
ncbi:MAG: flagellar brake protein [Gammaproteobacteria bacterium]|nr:flagellar brake protein [Gammaproteobacteria bacterium]